MSVPTRYELERWARNEVVTLRRLRALGVTKSEIATLVRRQHLYSGPRGIYFLNANPSRLATWTAAVARCGDSALLCDGPALVVWDVLQRWRGLRTWW